MNTLTKQFSAKDLQVDEGSREIVAVISTDSVDRDKDVLLPRGLSKKNYGGNPVVMVNHNHEQLPIGKTLWIKKEKNQIIAKYHISDKTQFARDVFGLIQDGVLKAHSVGFSFDPETTSPPTDRELKANPHWAGAKQVIRNWEMLEFSVVNVPCNQDCLAMSVAKGLSSETVKFLGDDFKEAPEVWRFEDEEMEALQNIRLETKKRSEAYGVPIESLAPTHCKHWSEVQAERMKSFDLENEFLARLMGRP